MRGTINSTLALPKAQGHPAGLVSLLVSTFRLPLPPQPIPDMPVTRVLPRHMSGDSGHESPFVTATAVSSRPNQSDQPNGPCGHLWALWRCGSERCPIVKAVSIEFCATTWLSSAKLRIGKGSDACQHDNRPKCSGHSRTRDPTGVRACAQGRDTRLIECKPALRSVHRAERQGGRRGLATVHRAKTETKSS